MIVFPFAAMILAYLYYDYISKESHRMSRKNPDDYKDDV